ncbi:hypothetical protein B5E58_08805 [Tyzzerella sp. An114]|uniref:VirB6/TrbL-like conjugal transfer protein, CD1112 family n=1 Tax=Tyzzerella sp. An114 TaxID=1965545 RepID=UPI000B44C83C|nr:CD0415/CD1112 family protein [Tyzzerella sp. An114]OUQ57664.1 hypothetical protein B5E58_08805 [Tyzzerella sp. An114]
MQSILESITKWLKELLITGITGNFSGLFDNVNQKVGEIANDVGRTPSQWNSSIFSMIQSLSENIIIPIAGIILTFIMCYELIQMITEKNNLHDIDTFIFFKWIFKTFVSVIIITNTFNIIMGVFDMAQHVVSQSSEIITSQTSIDISTVISDLETKLEEMELGILIGLWLQSFFINFTMHILSICIFIVIYGRIIEIYLMTSLGPIPFSTMANREWGTMGQNYIRALFAIGFQGFLIMVCVGIYSVLVHSISISDDTISSVWTCMGYTVLLCFSLFKTGTLSKSIFNAH